MKTLIIEVQLHCTTVQCHDIDNLYMTFNICTVPFSCHDINFLFPFEKSAAGM